MTGSDTARDRSELGFAALLGAVGVLVFVDASGLHQPESRADQVGPAVVPYCVAVLLIACAAWLAVEVLRGHRGEAEEGEDIDLSHPIAWRTVVPLLAVLLGNVLLIDLLGWVISGALLFWGTVWSLGSRHYVRDAVVAVSLALATFYGFYSGLGIPLPAGPLQGVL